MKRGFLLNTVAKGSGGGKNVKQAAAGGSGGGITSTIASSSRSNASSKTSSSVSSVSSALSFKVAEGAVSPAVRMRNDDASFVGIEGLKRRHAQQLDDFEIWATRRRWDSFRKYRMTDSNIYFPVVV
jgi:hypothetical protein